jgi:hypothetical protein
MSTVKSVKSVNSNVDAKYSEKFVKEMEKFFAWSNEQGYTIFVAKTNKQVEWKMNLLTSFEEPGRNKLEGYLRDLMKTYVIRKDSDEQDDYKVLAKEFKENKPKRKRSDSATTSATEDVVLVDKNLDTSETYYLYTLDFTTEQLQAQMGKAVKTGNKDASHRWEWKIKIGDNVYSVYDWKNEAGEFDDYQEAEWHVAGNKSNAKDMKTLKRWIIGGSTIGNKTVSKPQKKKAKDHLEDLEFEEVSSSEAESGDERQEKLTKELERELFGEVSDLEKDDTESLEINLDDLDD